LKRWPGTKAATKTKTPSSSSSSEVSSNLISSKRGAWRWCCQMVTFIPNSISPRPRVCLMWRKKIQKGAAEIYTLATLQQLRPTPAEFVILFKCCSVFVFDSIKAHFALFCLQLISTSQEPAGPEKGSMATLGCGWMVTKKVEKVPSQSNPILPTCRTEPSNMLPQTKWGRWRSGACWFPIWVANTRRGVISIDSPQSIIKCKPMEWLMQMDWKL